MPGYTEKNFTFYFVVELHTNFMWTVITRTPQGMLTAIAKIGGYFSFFTFVRVSLAYLHSYLFRKNLGKNAHKKFSYERMNRKFCAVKKIT